MAIGQMARSRVSPSADAVASGGASAVEVAGAADGTTKRVASSKVLLHLGGHVDDTSSVGCGVGGGTSAALVKLFFRAGGVAPAHRNHWFRFQRSSKSEQSPPN